MIGVIAEPAEHDVVREFFELFKTPWEFYREGGKYDVLLHAGDCNVDAAARLVVVYAARKTKLEEELGISECAVRNSPCFLTYEEDLIPIYGESITFGTGKNGLLADQYTREDAAYLQETNGRMQSRVGYDLFREVRSLLTVGQPAVNASMPALELHIAFLRDLILRAGISLTEIPPVPDGYRFIVCLSHDVDHPSIRQHKWDHTVLGFLYRATVGSMIRVLRGQMGARDLLSNWLAVLKLPLVHVGLASDFWREFGQRYVELEGGRPSTFFVIPFKGRPGKKGKVQASSFRASRYRARDIADVLRELQLKGCEIGVHGIDAWIDSERGREEFQEIQNLTEDSEIGVRMHWLYYEQESPMQLEHAGASYDSTVGYNETVGYRAGTTQAYKPLGAERLIELPMHAMDTALFYPRHLALSKAKAKELLDQMAANTARFGGVLTINWHDRSVAPERLWVECYRDLLADLEKHGAWFGTARQVVTWFRKRRSVTFDGGDLRSAMDFGFFVTNQPERVPGLLVRTHPSGASKLAGQGKPESYSDRKLGNFADSKVLRGAN